MTEHAEKLSALNAPRLVADGKTEIETFLARSDALYRRQRDKMAEALRAYQTARFALITDFDKRAQALVSEREDALHELDSKHERQRADDELALRRLKMLTGG